MGGFEYMVIIGKGTEICDLLGKSLNEGWSLSQPIAATDSEFLAILIREKEVANGTSTTVTGRITHR